MNEDLPSNSASEEAPELWASRWAYLDDPYTLVQRRGVIRGEHV